MPFLKDTLVSVFKQTHKNCEVVLIDDGSTDGSFEYAKTFESNHFRVYKNKRKGACAARNYGFELSMGEYIQYLDADDVLSKSKIENQLILYKKFGDTIITSCSWGKFKDNVLEVEWSNQSIDKDYKNPINWLIDSWSGLGMGQTSVWLTPRSIVNKVGVWNEDLQINQDGEFFSRVLLAVKQIKHSEIAKVYYRVGNQKSVSQKNNKSYSKATSLLMSYELCHQHTKSNLSGLELRKAVAQNYINFIYQFSPNYPDLLQQAEQNFKSLGFLKMWPVGGNRFQKIAKLVGFKKAIFVRNFLGI